MTTIAQAAARWRIANEQFTPIVGESMMEEKEALVAIIVQQQEEEKTDSNGGVLRSYKPSYKAEKIALGFSGETDFRLTGEFHEEMTLRVDGDNYEFESPARTGSGELKSEWLEKWNGSPIMLPTDENKEVMWRTVRYGVVEKIAEVTGCGIS